MASLTSTIRYMLLTPVMTVTLTILGGLAVITSILSSSFISLRLALLAIEFGFGITLNSAGQLLSWLKVRLQGQYRPKQAPLSTKLAKPNYIPIPHRAPIKKMYSKSVPNTPDPTTRRHEFAL
ncbi:hypothetical protein BJV82DRAFT_270497 [Fennellomyces sp. T-0311]|nr:hypothetical protein BJV82DRAFT_270497 [Fennellomyces sp. T-0311]